MQASPPSTPFSPATVALKDITEEEVSVILENLCFSSLVIPFRSYRVDGALISFIDCYQDVIDLSNCDVIVAQTLFEDYIQDWLRSGLVPKILLLPFMRVGSPV